MAFGLPAYVGPVYRLAGEIGTVTAINKSLARNNKSQDRGKSAELPVMTAVCFYCPSKPPAPNADCPSAF
jgi:hypothetical protein